MHALGLLLIIAFIIFIVPIIGIFQLILRFFFGKNRLSIFYFTDKISSTIKLLYPRQGKAPRYSLYFSST